MEFGDIKSLVLDDPELRRHYHEAHQQYAKQRREQEEAEAERAQSRPERLKAFWERLGIDPAQLSNGELSPREKLLAMPAAEAWIEEHPDELNMETAVTVVALGRLIRAERRRLKATRRILKELGIK